MPLFLRVQDKLRINASVSDYVLETLALPCAMPLWGAQPLWDNKGANLNFA